MAFRQQDQRQHLSIDGLLKQSVERMEVSQSVSAFAIGPSNTLTRLQAWRCDYSASLRRFFAAAFRPTKSNEEIQPCLDMKHCSNGQE